ncbi:hypothetical protein ADEAN_000024800 [Angomonas deanei]|uniref:Uncharacterized protein n=1 Tax=Angomonas deanei TaxID=59799 RepID=A0A7G2BZ65_9TRYP|nr:hypothetical protein ADEAN_000024800 [Angomonas deanei]
MSGLPDEYYNTKLRIIEDLHRPRTPEELQKLQSSGGTEQVPPAAPSASVLALLGSNGQRRSPPPPTVLSLSQTPETQRRTSPPPQTRTVLDGTTRQKSRTPLDTAAATREINPSPVSSHTPVVARPQGRPAYPTKPLDLTESYAKMMERLEKQL